jgi:hypothetical protein
LGRTEAIKGRLARQVEEELQNDIPNDERVTAIAIVVCGVLMLLYFTAHQRWSTGFFTATCGTLEALLLYRSLIYWIVASALLLVGRKNLSRDLDSFGGLVFATVGIARLLMVFPFEFARFADVVPDFLRFLVRWISNEIARVLMVLVFIVHLVAAVYSAMPRVFVRKARVARSQQE